MYVCVLCAYATALSGCVFSAIVYVRWRPGIQTDGIGSAHRIRRNENNKKKPTRIPNIALQLTATTTTTTGETERERERVHEKRVCVRTRYTRVATSGRHDQSKRKSVSEKGRRWRKAEKGPLSQPSPSSSHYHRRRPRHCVPHVGFVLNSCWYYTQTQIYTSTYTRVHVCSRMPVCVCVMRVSGERESISPIVHTHVLHRVVVVVVVVAVCVCVREHNWLTHSFCTNLDTQWTRKSASGSSVYEPLWDASRIQFFHSPDLICV